MRGTQVPCGIFFPFVSSLSLPPSLSPSLQTEQIFTKRRQKRIFRHLKIWIILKQETQIFAPHYILLFIHKRLSFNSPFCQGQIKDQIWIVIQHVFFLLKEKQQWEFPDKQSSFKIFPSFSGKYFFLNFSWKYFLSLTNTWRLIPYLVQSHTDLHFTLCILYFYI